MPTAANSIQSPRTLPYALPPNLKGGVDPRIRLILTIIGEQTKPGHLSSFEVSTLLGISERYFLRLFHREVSKTFREYLREIRMKRAAELLRNRALSIKGIASDSGYSDLSNFYRDFKLVHRMSPRQIRISQLIPPQAEDKAAS